jgi:hypothetical protein
MSGWARDIGSLKWNVIWCGGVKGKIGNRNRERENGEGSVQIPRPLSYEHFPTSKEYYIKPTP